jgi:hypothetical protein
MSTWRAPRFARCNCGVRIRRETWGVKRDGWTRYARFLDLRLPPLRSACVGAMAVYAGGHGRRIWLHRRSVGGFQQCVRRRGGFRTRFAVRRSRSCAPTHDPDRRRSSVVERGLRRTIAVTRAFVLAARADKRSPTSQRKICAAVAASMAPRAHPQNSRPLRLRRRIGYCLSRPYSRARKAPHAALGEML